MLEHARCSWAIDSSFNLIYGFVCDLNTNKYLYLRIAIDFLYAQLWKENIQKHCKTINTTFQCCLYGSYIVYKVYVFIIYRLFTIVSRYNMENWPSAFPLPKYIDIYKLKIRNTACNICSLQVKHCLLLYTPSKLIEKEIHREIKHLFS